MIPSEVIRRLRELERIAGGTDYVSKQDVISEQAAIVEREQIAKFDAELLAAQENENQSKA